MNMKNLKLKLLTYAMVAVLTGCYTSAPSTAIGFNYSVDNGKANGIVQVFDLGGNTVVQVRDLNPKTTQFLDGKNVPIAFKVVGENVVLAGMHSLFTVSTSMAASRVIRNSTAQVEHPIAIAVDTSVKQQEPVDSDAAIVAEITRMRKELADLKAMLTGAGAIDSAPPAPAVAVEERRVTPEPSVVIVPFPNNSRQFNPAQDQRAQLEELSRKAKNISVRGFTDSESSTPGSKALAKARAEAAKRYLVSMGVAAAKIVVDFDGAGNFIAENRTPAGRAANRRVEIEGT